MPAGKWVAILGRPNGRPPRADRFAVHVLLAVTILGHPEGRPPRRWCRRRCWTDRRCDPQSPRRATATSGRRLSASSAWALRSSAAPKGDRHAGRSGVAGAQGHVAILGRPEGRPPQRASSTCYSPGKLRSSATPKGDRHFHTLSCTRLFLCSCDRRPPRKVTATHAHDRVDAVRHVAILGRPEGRSPPEAPSGVLASEAVAILSHPEG